MSRKQNTQSRSASHNLLQYLHRSSQHWLFAERSAGNTTVRPKRLHIYHTQIEQLPRLLVRVKTLQCALTHPAPPSTLHTRRSTLSSLTAIVPPCARAAPPRSARKHRRARRWG